MITKVTEYFIKKGWRDTDIYFYLKFNLYILLVEILFLSLITLIETSQKIDVLLILGVFSIFLQSVALFSYKNSTVKTLYYSLIHIFYKNKDDREIQINRNYNEKKNIVKKKVYVEDKIKFIKENISDKQSMVRFILERDVRNNLLNWSTFLPLDLMNLDTKKRVISHDRMLKPGKCSLNKNIINRKFNKYSSKDLLRIFSSYYYFDDYLYCLETDFEGEFPIMTNIKDLRNYIMDMSEEDYSLEDSYTWLKRLPKTYKVVQNKRELFDWAEDMQNCLRSYDDKLKRKKSIVLSYIDFGEFLYVIEALPNGIVKEIKGYKNEQPFKSDDVRIRKEIYRAFNN